MSLRNFGRKLSSGFKHFGKKLGGDTRHFGNKLAIGVRKGLNTVGDISDFVAPVATILGRLELAMGAEGIGSLSRGGARVVNRGRKLANNPSIKQLDKFVGEIGNFQETRNQQMNQPQSSSLERRAQVPNLEGYTTFI